MSVCKEYPVLFPRSWAIVKDYLSLSTADNVTITHPVIILITSPVGEGLSERMKIEQIL